MLLMKFYPLSSEVARQMVVAEEGESVGEVLFVVNQQEADIIDYPHSLFVLGRSGALWGWDGGRQVERSMEDDLELGVLTEF